MIALSIIVDDFNFDISKSPSPWHSNIQLSMWKTWSLHINPNFAKCRCVPIAVSLHDKSSYHHQAQETNNPILAAFATIVSAIVLAILAHLDTGWHWRTLRVYCRFLVARRGIVPIQKVYAFSIVVDNRWTPKFLYIFADGDWSVCVCRRIKIIKWCVLFHIFVFIILYLSVASVGGWEKTVICRRKLVIFRVVDCLHVSGSSFHSFYVSSGLFG